MTGRKIKIALCLSGEPRSSMFCFPYIYESFINLGPEYEVDVYIHSWKNFRALPIYKPKKFLIQNLDNPASYINYEFKDIFPVLEEFLKEQKELYNSFTERTNLFLNSLLMISSHKNCFDLIKEDYDVYIRCRYDILFNNKFKIHNIIHDIISKKYDMFIPQKKYLNSNPHLYKNELNDQLAIGNFKSMYSYSNLKHTLPNLLKLTKKWGPEIWIRKQLEIDNIKLNEYLLDYLLVRQVNISSNADNNEFLDQ
jgi:hypothetical protein